jgi:isocitrate dehydrogenase kinase/phosphatase
MRLPNKKFITRKIPLELFISLLEEIYVNTNSEYIDLRSEIDPSKQQDKIFAIVKEEYIKKIENKQNFVPEVPEKFLNTIVSSDINDILNNI